MGERRCVACGRVLATPRRPECSRCRSRRQRGVDVTGKPLCEEPGCGNIAQANARRCARHALGTLSYHVEPGPLPSMCRIVDGERGRWGYGCVNLPDGRKMDAHRAIWTMFVGPIPAGMWVLHRCDRPGCIWLPHLYLGTPADNIRDMHERGRGGTIWATRRARYGPTGRKPVVGE